MTSRTRAKAEAILDRGGASAETPAAVATSGDIVFTMVGYPSEVEEVLLGDHGVVAPGPGRGGRRHDLESPIARREDRAAAARAATRALDAPVSGGDVGARGGTLSIMVGGEPRRSPRCDPAST